ncbi:MAG: hypothetical protein LBS57_10125 [Treponema sp.]|jgi:predicted small secreted protein|nr:hypothetical protein [Treponema sp.]
MKKNKFVLLALVLAAFAVTGCQNSLTETSPGLGDLNRSKGFETGAAASPASYYPNYSGAPDVTGGSEQKSITLTFPDDRGLDFLNTPNGSTFTDFTAIDGEIHKFLHFYSLGAKANDQAASPHAGEITYKVVRRDGSEISLELSSLSASTSEEIEVYIDPNAYTFNDGQKIDLDGNGAAGEAWFDDYYHYLAVTAAVGTPSASIGKRNPRKGAEFTFRWKDGPAGIAGNPGDNGTIRTDQDLYLDIAYNGYTDFNDTINRSAAINSLIVIEKYNRSRGTYEEISPRRSVEQQSDGNNNYHLQISGIMAFDLIRVRVVNDPVKGFTVGPYFGGQQRYYNTGITLTSDAAKKSKNNTVLRLSVEPVDYENNIDTKFWSNADVFRDENGYNVSLILDLDSSIVGDLYFGNSLPADFAKYFKIGYLKADDYTTTTVTSNPGSSWNKLSFVPIKLAGIRYSSLNPPATAVRDQLRVDLDPDFKYESGGRLYVIIGTGFGYRGDSVPGIAPGVFGNFRNVSLLIDGVSGFVNYGYVPLP